MEHRSDPFITKTSAASPIDLSLFCHILNDPFLAGTYALEGNQFGRTTSYLLAYCRASSISLSGSIHSLLTEIDYLHQIAVQMQYIKSMEQLLGLSGKISLDIINLTPGATLTIPGGWKSPAGGHAMTYQFKRVREYGTDKLLFVVYNSGDGLEYHDRISNKDKELYSPIQTYSIPLPCSVKDLAQYISSLLLASMPGLRDDEALRFSAQTLYEEVLPGIHYLRGTLVATPPGKGLVTAGQLSGTCAQKSLQQLLKDSLPSLVDYQRFILSFKHHAFMDYLDKARTNHDINLPEVQSLVKKAAHGLLRILNTPKLVPDAKKEEIKKEIQTALATLPPPVWASPSSIVHRPLHFGKAYFDLILPPPSHVKINAEGTTSAATPSWSAGPRCLGGSGLLEQLRDYKEQVAKKDPTVAIEWIESLIASFPLPMMKKEEGSTEKKIHSFYAALDATNKAEFAELLGELSALYTDALNAIGAKGSYPRQVVTGLTCTTLLAELAQAIPPEDTALAGAWQAVTHSLLQQQDYSPYLATKNPSLDQRLNVIRSLSKPYVLMTDYVALYNNIFATRPDLKKELLRRFEEIARTGTDPNKKDAERLRNFSCAELYYLIRFKNELSKESQFVELCKEWDTKEQIELKVTRILKVSERSSHKATTSISINPSAWGAAEAIQSPLKNLRLAKMSEYLLQSRYDVGGIPAHALHSDHDIKGVITRRDDNTTQLYSCKGDVLVELASHEAMVDPEELVARELHHLRHAPTHQVMLTLEYFSRHRDKLANNAYRRYVQANLFQPSLLLTALTNPQFVTLFEAFIVQGLIKAKQEGNMGAEQTLFYLNLKREVLAYALKAPLPAATLATITAQAEHFTTQLDLIIQESTSQEVCDSLRYLRFLHHWSRQLFAQQCLDAAETTRSLSAFVQDNFTDYLCMQQAPNRLTHEDEADQIDRACIDYAFRTHLAAQAPECIAAALRSALPVVSAKEGIGFRIHYEEALKQFRIDSDDIGTQELVFDVDSGRIRSRLGLTLSPTPLALLTHPVLKSLHIEKPERCFLSADGMIAELGSPPMYRFIKEGIDYRVQRYISQGTKGEWYELVCGNADQLPLLGTRTRFVFFPGIPDILLERENHLWVSTNPERPEMLLTQRQQPIYHFYPSERGTSSVVVKEYSGEGILCPISSSRKPPNRAEGAMSEPVYDWVYKYLASVEAADFITIVQSATDVKVKLARYGLSLRGTLLSDGQLRLQLTTNPKWVVSAAPITLAGIAALVLTHEETRQQQVYLPIQQFINTGTRAPESEFYRLQQDLNGRLAKVALSLASTRPCWQYSNTESMLVMPLDASGEPQPTTAEQALYLAYLYLGTHKPEKAFTLLEYCQDVLGGLRGTAAERRFIHWIVNSLPKLIKPEDALATCKTPPYVACQLKAMALLTKFWTPGQSIPFVDNNNPPNTPEHLVQECRNKTLADFYSSFNTKLYTLYTRYQSMKPHLHYHFNLDDRTRLSLLSYYHYNLPDANPKTLGALGYEWEELRLRRLAKEHHEIRLLSCAHGEAFPKALANRLRLLDAEIVKRNEIYAHHTEIECIAVDMSLPEYDDFFLEPKLDEDDAPYWALQDSFDKPITVKSAWSKEASSALDALDSSTSDFNFFTFFKEYLTLVLEQAPSPSLRAAQQKLLDFCSRTILANRHIPWTKQNKKLVHGCHVLWRVYYRNERMPDCTYKTIFKEVKKFTLKEVGGLKVWQAQSKTTALLAKVSSLWADAQKAVAPLLDEHSFTREEITDSDYSVKALLASMTCEESTLAARVKDYYTATAQFGAPPEASSTDEGISILDAEEKRQGVIQYNALQTQRRAAVALVSNPADRAQFYEALSQQAVALTLRKAELLDSLLRFANQGPEDPSARLRQNIEVESQVRAVLDETQLLSLYLQENKAQYLMTTGLSAEQVTRLHAMIGAWLHLAVRGQSIERCQRLYATMGDGVVTDPLACQRLVHELLTEDLIDYSKDTIAAVLQYQGKILLRPVQKEALSRLVGDGKPPYPERVEQIIMGGGKSKVLIPALARKKAKGNNLVVVEVPQALLETNYLDLSNTSGRLYQQRVHLFQFNRESDCSPKQLHFLYERLTETMVNRDYLLTTGDAVQSLELKYLEILQAKPQSGDCSTWVAQTQGLERLVTLFRTRADVLIDEVHQGLELKKKLNYTVDAPRALPPQLIKQCVELYAFFDCVHLDLVSGLAHYAGKTLTDLLLDNSLMVDDESWHAVLDSLAQQLIRQERSPLHTLLAALEPALGDADLALLITYLAGAATAVPSCVERVPPEVKQTLALYKEQLSVLLGRTLRRNLNEHYGLSHLHPDTPIAIPYASNNTPSEHSRFGNILESVNLTIQMTLIEGASPQLIKQYLSDLKQKALGELLANPGLKKLDATPTSRHYMELLGGFDPSYSLSLALDNEAVFMRFYKKLRHHKSTLCILLQEYILKHIELSPSILHSDALNHVALYRSCQGLTGTPSNSTTFNDRLLFEKGRVMAIDGFIAQLLTEKGTPLFPVERVGEEGKARSEQLIAPLFQHTSADCSVRSIIDICARFKGIKNHEVALAIKAYIHRHEDLFSLPGKGLKYVLFFNQENILCALNIHADEAPIIIGSSEAANIDTLLCCTKEERFTYYDQAHTLGVDITQDSKACGLVLVDEHTTLKQFNQGCLRMRALDAEQSLRILCPAPLCTLGLEKLIAKMANNEEDQLKEDTFMAAQAKMRHCFRAEVLQRILNLPEEECTLKADYLARFAFLFMQHSSLDFFALYGGVDTHLSTRVILEGLKKRLLKQWREQLKELGIYRKEEEHALIAALNQIITTAERRCASHHLSPQRENLGQEVEIQQAVEVELERQMEVQKEMQHAKKNPAAYQSLNIYMDKYSLHPDCYQSLEALCAAGGRKAPGFSPQLFASKNYYQTYSTKDSSAIDYLDKHLKPAHILVFKHDDKGALTCLLVSQREAEELTFLWRFYPDSGLWLSTTQHTVLAGRRPESILSNPEYLSLIEQVRFFNGELDSIIDTNNPKLWLATEPAQKLDFFTRHLMPRRETSKHSLHRLKQLLITPQGHAVEFLDELTDEETLDTVPYTEDHELTTSQALTPVPSPVPEPAPSPVPEPTPSPVPEPTPSPVPEPAPSPVPEPAPSPVPEPIPSPVPEPIPSPVPEPAPSPVPKPTPIPVPEPVPSPVPEPNPLLELSRVSESNKSNNASNYSFIWACLTQIATAIQGAMLALAFLLRNAVQVLSEGATTALTVSTSSLFSKKQIPTAYPIEQQLKPPPAKH